MLEPRLDAVVLRLGLAVHQVIEAIEQGVDVARDRVGCQAGTGGALHSERPDQRLGTMVAAAQRYAMATEVMADFRRAERRDAKEEAAGAPRRLMQSCRQCQIEA